MTAVCLQRPYPIREGLPISLKELGLPQSILNPEVRSNWNNHHSYWTRRAMGFSAILRTVRDLDSSQDVIPTDIHTWAIHRIFEPPKVSIESAYFRVHEAFEAGEVLRYGSAYNPRYDHLTPDIMDLVEDEWQSLGVRL